MSGWKPAGASANGPTFYFNAKALSSVFQPETALFNNGIGQHLAGDSSDLGLGFGAIQTIVEREHKILSLPNIGHSAVLHPVQRICHCLPLGIQHGSFQRDIDMSLHLV